MINLLYGEFYKLRKSKCVYICCMILIVCVAFIYGMFVIADKIQKGEAENSPLVMVEVENNTEAASSIWEEISVLDIAQQLFGAFAGIITAIFASIFVIGEYGHGAIKNVTGKGYARWKIFFAKYLSTTLVTVLMLIIMSIANLLCGIIFMGTDGLNMEFYQNWCSYTGIQLLFGAALVGIIIVISEICRNLGTGISIGICLVSLSSLVTGGLDMVFYRWNMKPSDYWITDLISNCPITNIDSEFMIRAVAASVVWIVLSLCIGGLHFQKADVK